MQDKGKISWWGSRRYTWRFFYTQQEISLECKTSARGSQERRKEEVEEEEKLADIQTDRLLQGKRGTRREIKIEEKGSHTQAHKNEMKRTRSQRDSHQAPQRSPPM